MAKGCPGSLPPLWAGRLVDVPTCHVCTGLLVRQCDGAVRCSECGREPRVRDQQVLELRQVPDEVLVQEIRRRPELVRQLARVAARGASTRQLIDEALRREGPEAMVARLQVVILRVDGRDDEYELTTHLSTFAEAENKPDMAGRSLLR